MMKLGSSSQAAITLSDDGNDNDSDSSKAAKKKSTASGRPGRAAASTKQPRKGSFNSKHAAASKRKRAASAVATSSSSDDGAVVVAASRTTSAKYANSQQRQQQGSQSQATSNGKTQTQSQSQGQKKRKLTKAGSQPVITIVDNDDDAEKEREDEAAANDTDQEDVSVAKPSFAERLSQNIKSSPKFSKGFRGKVKGSESTSIPLADDRFDSAEDDEDGYESPDRPSPRKKKRALPTSPKSKGKGKANNFESVQEISTEAETESEKATRSENKGKGRATTENGNESSPLPEFPQVIGDTSSRALYQSRLEHLSSSRKEKQVKTAKKEKRKKRVVASAEPEAGPSSKKLRKPSPEDVLSDPEATAQVEKPKNRRKKKEAEKQSTPKVASSSPRFTAGHKKSQPLFVESDDDEDNNDTAPTATVGQSHKSRHDSFSDSDILEEPVRPKSKIKQKSKKGKSKKRRPPESSSTSSSSSAGDSDDSDAAHPIDEETEDEDADGPENLEMDFNPIQRERLRPINVAKERKLDVLREARARKQLKAERLRKGIVDSDDDEEVKPEGTWQGAKKESSSSDDGEGEEETGSSIPDLSDNEEDFIVEDEGKDEKEKRIAEKLMPTQYSKHARKDLEEHFASFVSFLVYLYIFPRSKRISNNEEFKFSRLAIEKEITGIINSGIASSIWKEEFRAAIDERPEMEMNHIKMYPGCEGCNLRDRTATVEAIISGKRYDRDTFEEEDEREDAPQTFALGRFCAEKCELHHALKHFQYRTKIIVHEKCEEMYHPPNTADKEERDKQRDKEAARIIKHISSGRVNMVAQLWDELRMTLERARTKYTK